LRILWKCWKFISSFRKKEERVREMPVFLHKPTRQIYCDIDDDDKE
jgi:hypothetical protein